MKILGVSRNAERVGVARECKQETTAALGGYCRREEDGIAVSWLKGKMGEMENRWRREKGRKWRIFLH